MSCYWFAPFGFVAGLLWVCSKYFVIKFNCLVVFLFHLIYESCYLVRYLCPVWGIGRWGRFRCDRCARCMLFLHICEVLRATIWRFLLQTDSHPQFSISWIYRQSQCHRFLWRVDASWNWCRSHGIGLGRSSNTEKMKRYLYLKSLWNWELSKEQRTAIYSRCQCTLLILLRLAYVSTLLLPYNNSEDIHQDSSE